jgi:hypothetical protein
MSRHSRSGSPRTKLSDDEPEFDLDENDGGKGRDWSQAAPGCLKPGSLAAMKVKSLKRSSIASASRSIVRFFASNPSPSQSQPSVDQAESLFCPSLTDPIDHSSLEPSSFLASLAL